MSLVTPQPPPKQDNPEPAIWDLVIADMKARDEFGHRKYGTRLRAYDGRDTLVDAYQESLDKTVYLRKLIYERDNPTIDVIERRRKRKRETKAAHEANGLCRDCSKAAVDGRTRCAGCAANARVYTSLRRATGRN